MSLQEVEEAADDSVRVLTALAPVEVLDEVAVLLEEPVASVILHSTRRRVRQTRQAWPVPLVAILSGMSKHDREDLDADDPATYLKITKMRETAERVHGRETIERVTEEYREIRAELQKRPPYERRDELQKAAARLESQYGYEVLAGVPRVTRGSHPRHDWDV